MNPLRQLLQQRAQLHQAIRAYFAQTNCLEADSPLLAPAVIPESYLEIFETVLYSPSLSTPKPACLLSSPEAFLKRLLVTQSGSVFYLGKALRNGEPMGKWHNHEFTILEWYRVGFEYRRLMKDIEQMFKYLAVKLPIDIGINFEKDWECLTIAEASARFAQGHELTPENFEKIYVQFIEPNLGTRGVPTFIYDFPAQQSPLAKSNNGLAERFELYINGVELVNGWTELTDAALQAENLHRENALRKHYGKQELPMDNGFVESLKQGMPECAGAAMGVDRLLMVLCDYSSIEEVIPFSTKNLFHKK